jgi:hypothetical protein
VRDYSRKLWIRCEAALAEAITAEIGRAGDDVTARASASFIREVR